MGRHAETIEGQREKGVEFMNYMLAYQPTWIDRLRWKLFPVEVCDIPDIPAKDCLIVRTEVRLSFIGRIQAFFSGRVMVETKTVTENVIGNATTASCSYVKAPKFIDRRDG